MTDHGIFPTLKQMIHDAVFTRGHDESMRLWKKAYAFKDAHGVSQRQMDAMVSWGLWELQKSIADEMMYYHETLGLAQCPRGCAWCHDPDTEDWRADARAKLQQ